MKYVNWRNASLVIALLAGITWSFSICHISPSMGGVEPFSSEYLSEGKNRTFGTDQNGHNNSEDIAILNELLNSMNQSLGALKEEIDAYKREGDERIKQLEQSISRLNIAADETSADDSFASEPDPDTMEIERLERHKRAVQQTELFDQALSEEERDEAWATEMEDSMFAASQDAYYSGSNFSVPNCKSTFCRMEAYHDDEESRDKFENIRRQLTNSYHIQHFEEGGGFRSVIYFVRQGAEPSNVIFQTLNAM